MNELTTRYDWEVQMRSLRNTHVVLSSREASIWEYKIQGAVQRLPYLKSVGHLRLDEPSVVVAFKVVLTEVANNLESVKADIRGLIKNHIIGGRRTYVTFASTTSGFDVWLGVLDEDERVFGGLIRVEAS